MSAKQNDTGVGVGLRARNRRTGLILASIALVFFIGIVVKFTLAH